MLFKENEDEIANWWTSVVAVACNWLLGQENECESLYSKVENIPESLLSLNDPLPKAVVAAYMARKTYLMQGTKTTQKVIMYQCDIAGQLIEDSLTFNSCKQQNGLALVSLQFYYFNYFIINI